MKKLRLFIIVLILISMFILNIHDSLHDHSGLFTNFGEYRMNIPDSHECIICRVEKYIGKLFKLVDLVVIISLTTGIILWLEFCFERINYYFSPESLVDLHVRMDS